MAQRCGTAIPNIEEPYGSAITNSKMPINAKRRI